MKLKSPCFEVTLTSVVSLTPSSAAMIPFSLIGILGGSGVLVPVLDRPPNFGAGRVLHIHVLPSTASGPC